MIGAGIMPGDVVIVRSQPTASTGEIVVALVDDEATVKTLRLRPGRIELHPENPEFEPLVFHPNECVILGKIIEVRRYVAAAFNGLGMLVICTAAAAIGFAAALLMA